LQGASYIDVERARWFLQKYREIAHKIIDACDDGHTRYAVYEHEGLRDTLLGMITSLDACFDNEFEKLLYTSSFIDNDAPSDEAFINDLRAFHGSLALVCKDSMKLNTFFASRRLDDLGSKIFSQFSALCTLSDDDGAEHLLFKINMLILTLAYFLCEVQHGRPIGWYERSVNAIPLPFSKEAPFIVSTLISGGLAVVGLYLKLSIVSDAWSAFRGQPSYPSPSYTFTLSENDCLQWNRVLDVATQSVNASLTSEVSYRTSLDRQELIANGLEILERGLVGGVMLLLSFLYEEKARFKKKDKNLNLERIYAREAIVPQMIKHKNSFDSVRGEQYEVAKNELMVDVRAIKNHLKFEKYNSGPSRGILLHGPNGVGKTLLAQLFAHEIGYAFVVFDAADILNDVEDFQERCEKAAARAPVVILIDELQNVCGDGPTFKSAQSKLCTIINGSISKKPYDAPVIFIAAMSEDPACLGGGLKRRFERKIELTLPNEASRMAIIEYVLRKEVYATKGGIVGAKKLSMDVDFGEIARLTDGLSCDEVVKYIEGVRQRVVDENGSVITRKDFLLGLKV